ncbi:MAG: DNA modification methylase [Acidobacteria bacterium]|nr:MAG: DNA modification methylase [Acidobacteriota bacterium]
MISSSFTLPFSSIDPGFPALQRTIETHRWKGRPTHRDVCRISIDERRATEVNVYTNEFWTRRHRAANSLHQVSYRACFKPQLPRFFIELLTHPGEFVYDPFMGRGTTPIEAAIMQRVPFGCDVNPLSIALTAPRLSPPTLLQVRERLAAIDFSSADALPEHLLVFYHPETLREICALKSYLKQRAETQTFDPVDNWVRMVALNRLTGHSQGFFSVYTLPPNQAVSPEAQGRINEKRRQVPPRRGVPTLILAKSESLLRDCDVSVRQALGSAVGAAKLMTSSSKSTPEIPSGSVALVVTSPPFLNTVDYAADNWLRCWFCDIDATQLGITVVKRLDEWSTIMGEVFRELFRVVRSGGHVAFEVGEIRNGQLRLEEAVLPQAAAAGFEPVLVMINSQHFTKTANCWGVRNNSKGTNTNRIVVLKRPA